MSIIPDLLSNVDAEAVSSVIVREESYTPKRNFLFDFAANEFVTNPIGGVASTDDPRETLRVIVEKILNDDRYRWLVYDNSYGNEILTMLAQGYPYEIVEAELKRLYEEALVYHPAIESLSDFSFSHKEGTDAIFVTFTVHGAAGVDYKTTREVHMQ